MRHKLGVPSENNFVSVCVCARARARLCVCVCRLRRVGGCLPLATPACSLINLSLSYPSSFSSRPFSLPCSVASSVVPPRRSPLVPPWAGGALWWYDFGPAIGLHTGLHPSVFSLSAAAFAVDIRACFCEKHVSNGLCAPRFFFSEISIYQCVNEEAAREMIGRRFTSFGFQ